MKNLSVLKYKKWLAVFLTAVMLLSMLPTFIFNASAQEGNFRKISDPATVNDWKIFFGQDVKNTTWAGSVWSDKSVFTSVADYKAATDEADDNLNLSIGANNFLVSLSTIAASKSIEGYSTLPTDTILVLDLSGSMDVSSGTDPYVTMVSAANDAIDTLIGLNANNRVGVIAYSGNTAVNQAATASTATVILPLGKWEKGIGSNNEPAYLVSSWKEKSGNYYVTRNGVKVASGVTGTKAEGVKSDFSENNQKIVTGGTYTQNGIYQAMNMFSQVSETQVTDGVQAGTKRKPVMVLMSDGSPTIATTNYTKIETSDSGNGTESSYGSIGISFMTQLTASFAKDTIEKKYSNEALVYTLGLNVGNKQAALSLLDPSNNTAADTLWATFKSKANSSNKNMSVKINVDGNESKTITYVSPVNEAKGWNKNYVTKYFGADNTKDFTKAFNDIVEQIVIQSLYYPTLVESSIGVDHDGFLEFDDYIGKNMEVKEVKGIQLGSTLYNGSTLARMIYSGGMGTADNPTTAGDNFVRAVKTRMGISDTSVARELIRMAYSQGQLYYNPTTGEYSNYIGWYADGKGKYVGFWDGKDTSPDAVPAELKDKAVFAVKSYGYYDAVGEGHRKTDMMYATIQVRTTLKNEASDKYDASQVGDIRVIGKIPASLIPLVEYNIKLNGTDPMNPSSMEIIGATAPSRLLYEVGLNSKIDVLNIEETAPDPLVKNSDGDYVFYTNQWNEIGEYSYLTNKNTISYFEPSIENERYYYNIDSDIFADTNGTAYKSATTPVYNENKPLYRRYLVYSEKGGNIVAKYEYEQISAHVLEHEGDIARRDDNSWYITAGTIHHYYGAYEKEKAENLTGTIKYSDKPFVHDPMQGKEDQGDYHVDSYLGNNGMLILNAFEGVKISKSADATIQDKTVEYEFTAFADLNDKITFVKDDVDGNRTEIGIDFNGSYTFKLRHGETAYLLGDALIGKTVKIKENIPADARYRVYSINGDTLADYAELTVSDAKIEAAEFINTIPQEGDVVITKNVVSTYGAHNETEFSFKVDISADGEFTAVKTDGSVITVKSGDTVALKHGQSVNIEGIPENATVTVTEINIPNGFNASNAVQSVTVKSGETHYIDFTNTYAADKTDGAGIEITVNKKLTDNSGAPADHNATFEFRLQKWNGSAYDNLGNSIMIDYTKNGANTVQIDLLKNEVYHSAGTYYYRIIEVEDSQNVANGIIYDTAYSRFAVNVVDDGNGKLKIDSITNIAETVVDGKKVTAEFNNIYNVSGAVEVVFDIGKTVKNAYGQTANILPAGFSFSLFEADGNYQIINNTAVASSPVTSAAGTASLSVIYDDISDKGTHYYILKENGGNIEGVTYTTKTYKVKVVVDDEGGYLKADATVYDGDSVIDTKSVSASASYLVAIARLGGIHFENTYTPKAVTVSNLGGIKRLLGREATANDNFTFALYETRSDFNTSGITPKTAAANFNAGGTFSFGDIAFDREGTHYFVVKEVIPDDAVNGKLYGITYDTREYRIKVEVTGDAVTGKLSAVSAMTVFDGVGSAESATMVFTNTYTYEGTVAEIIGNKTLTGGIRNIQAGAFSFALYENGNIVKTVSNLAPDSNNSALFKFDISYNTAGVYNYTVKEVVPNGVNGENMLDGVKYDSREYDVTVTVTDDGRGKLVADVHYDDGDISFENSYTVTSATVTIDGKKLLKGDDISKYTESNAFAFEIYTAYMENGCIVEGTKLETVKNTGNGSFVFAPLTFSKIGGYRYIIREVVPKNANALMEYDTSVYLVEIDVIDNLRGGLDTNITYTKYKGNEVTNEGKVEFNNTLHLEKITVVIEGTKKYNKPLVGGQFTFELYQALKRQDGKISSVGDAILTTNDANGRFVFREDPDTTYITYDKAGVYYYVIKEFIPDGAENGIYEGIAYDTSEYVVIVTVTEEVENGRSVLKAKVSYEDTVVFENQYRAEGSAKISGKKILEGRTLSDKEFTFVLSDKDGNEIKRATNNADGDFEFIIDYNTAGVYEYTLKESSEAKAKGITYDDSVYTVKVTVEDNGDGTLSAVSAYSFGGEAVQKIEFVNTYSEPSPETGDKMNVSLVMTMGLISLLMCGILLILKKRSLKA